jgi:trimeric autotransporter adhesin
MAKLTGTAGDDTIIGAFAINDTLSGGAGDDLLFGYGDAKGGIGLPPPSPDPTGGGALDNDLLNGGLGDDTVRAGNGNDTLLGGDGIDQLFGDFGMDRLDGGAGADIMDGGVGDDLYIVDNAGDKAAEQFADPVDGTDTVLSSVSFALDKGIENLTLTGKAANTGTGNNLNNLITGNAAANTLSGAGGNDTLNGGAGADSMAGGADNDIYVIDNAGDKATEVALEGTDTIRWMLNKNLDLAAFAEIENATLLGVAAVSLTGTAANNVLQGNAGANTIDGAGGADTLAGGGGNDTYVANGGDTIIELANGGIDRVESTVDITLSDNVENLDLFGAGLAGFGNDLKNVISGTGGDDLLDGGGGADTLIGGGGNDEYVVGAGDIVSETLAGPAGGNSDTVLWIGSGAYTLGANLEELSLGPSATNGTGNALDNAIFGNGSNNVLDGKAGADFMRGEPGDDIYIVDNPGDQAIEILFAGTDHVLSSVTFAIGPNIENLTLTGKAAIDGIGNVEDNRLVGNGANNKLDGGDGVDTLLGGAGNDVLNAGIINLPGTEVLDGGTGADTMTGSVGPETLFIVDNIGDKVSGDEGRVESSVTFSLEGTGVEDLTLTGKAAINGFGSTEANVIVGNAAANKLSGLASQDSLLGNGGNDTLDGGQTDGVIDTLRGGAGNDRYLVGAGDLAIEDAAGAAGGIDTVVSDVDFTLGANIENLTIVGTASIGVGNDLANKIIGNDEDNLLLGAGGADTLVGGKGNDSYVVDSAGDKIVELAGDDADEVTSSVDFVLGAQLENLFLTGGSSKGTGNAKDNILRGSTGNDTLDGKGGADDLDGLSGDDTLIVDNLGDTTFDSIDGIDLVLSSVSHAIGGGIDNLTLTGKAAISGIGNGNDNLLAGNGGANSLDGGAGSDTLIGGAGNDTLTGGAASDVFAYLSGAVGKDTITDFNPGIGDAIDIGDMLTGYVEGVSNVNDFAQLAFTGGDAILRVDANGLAGGSKFTDVAVITGGVNQTVTELVASNNLVLT